MKRWLIWIAVPLCLLALVLSICRPKYERWFAGGQAFILYGPCGHAAGVTIWGPDPCSAVGSGRRLMLWWSRIDASGYHSWGADLHAHDTPPGI